MTSRFIWHELLATDTKAAIAFYSEVIGWKTELFGDSPAPSPYTMWVGSQGPLGGVMKLPDDAKAMGVPPRWVGYVEVDNIDATLTKVRAKGGRVDMPPTAIPKVGRFSMIADPQGASLYLLQPEPMEQPPPPRDKSKHGEISWNELHAADAKTAFVFYSELFGWKIQEELDMGPAGKYMIYGQGDERYGGMMTKEPDMPMPPSWVYYISVDDLDATIARATSLGAKTLYGPMAVPGGTRIAQLTDPQGALFALNGPGA